MESKTFVKPADTRPVRNTRTHPSERKYHHGTLREALLQSAANRVAASSVVQVTVRDLAEDTGVTSAAFYRHFTSIDQLLDVLYIQGLELLEEAETEAARRSDGDAIDRIVAMLRAYVRFAIERPGLFRLIVNSDIGSRPTKVQKYRPAINMIVDAVKQGQSAGQIIDGNPRDLAISAWSTLHGLAALLTTGPMRAVLEDRPARAQQLENAAVHFIRRGLVKPVIKQDRQLSMSTGVGS